MKILQLTIDTDNDYFLSYKDIEDLHYLTVSIKFNDYLDAFKEIKGILSKVKAYPHGPPSHMIKNDGTKVTYEEKCNNFKNLRKSILKQLKEDMDGHWKCFMDKTQVGGNDNIVVYCLKPDEADVAIDLCEYEL